MGYILVIVVCVDLFVLQFGEEVGHFAIDFLGHFGGLRLLNVRTRTVEVVLKLHFVGGTLR
jgi:hypothetical protein